MLQPLSGLFRQTEPQKFLQQLRFWQLIPPPLPLVAEALLLVSVAPLLQLLLDFIFQLVVSVFELPQQKLEGPVFILNFLAILHQIQLLKKLEPLQQLYRRLHLDC